MPNTLYDAGKASMKCSTKVIKLRNTVFENHPKSRIHHCERSKIRLHFEWTKLIENAKRGPFWQVFFFKLRF